MEIINSYVIPMNNIRTKVVYLKVIFGLPEITDDENYKFVIYGEVLAIETVILSYGSLKSAQ